MKVVSNTEKDPARNSQLHIINTENGQSRRLFTDPEQLKYSNAMPSVSPDGSLIAFVSNRKGMMRIWVSELNGSNAKLISSQTRRITMSSMLPLSRRSRFESDGNGSLIGKELK